MTAKGNFYSPHGTTACPGTDEAGAKHDDAANDVANENGQQALAKA